MLENYFTGSFSCTQPMADADFFEGVDAYRELGRHDEMGDNFAQLD